MSTNPRKRPAPGAPPIALPQMPGTNDQVVQWANQQQQDPAYSELVRASPSYARTMNDMGLGGGGGGGGAAAVVATTNSSTLARRPAGASRALIPASQRNLFGNVDWPFEGDVLSLQESMTEVSEHDNMEKLEEAALKAKRDSLAKRKQIPPFVQKLSSFLEERKNEDLIKWSEKGDSFIVLDEDEFAKTLIPDMFKHNNYASFVRQLNMYGFHKRVGLSDNSMRASERKNKSPSEYANPYFRRGHPNLLWLINKPKSGSKTKKGSKASGGGVDIGDVDSDEDGGGAAEAADALNNLGNNSTHALLGRSQSSSEYTPAVKKEIASIHEEVARLKDQNSLVLSHLARLQSSNKELYRRVAELHSLNDRHQNSINAILSFLANVFRKTVPDQGAAQGLNDVLMNLQMPANQGGGGMHGSIVDLGEVLQSSGVQAGMGMHRKQRPLLLPAAAHGEGQNQNQNQQRMRRGDFGIGTVTELYDTLPDAPQPDPEAHYLAKELESNPETIMQFIRDTNATAQQPAQQSQQGQQQQQLTQAQQIAQAQQMGQAQNQLGQQLGQNQNQLGQQLGPQMGPNAIGQGQQIGQNPQLGSNQLSQGQQQIGQGFFSGRGSPNVQNVQNTRHQTPPTRQTPQIPQVSQPPVFTPHVQSTAIPTTVAHRATPTPTIPSPAASAPTPTTLASISAATPLAPSMASTLLPSLEYDQAQIENLRRMSEDSTTRLNNISSRLGGLSPNLADINEYFPLGDEFDHQADMGFDPDSFINQNAEFGDFGLDGADLAGFPNLDLAQMGDEPVKNDGGGGGGGGGEDVGDAERAPKRRRED